MKKALLAVLLAAWAAPALAQEKTFELKISHWVPASHPLQKALEDWGASVEKASGGTIKSRVFPAQQLGKAFDHYDMARDGIADVTYVNPGYQPGRFPIIGAGELPFLMSDAKGGSMGLDAWYRKYAEKEMKDVKFCLAFIHAPSSFHSRTKKIVVPDDIKGMKIRPPTPRSRISSRCWAAPTCSRPRLRSATSSSAAWRMPSPSRGDRWCCSASTR